MTTQYLNTEQQRNKLHSWTSRGIKGYFLDIVNDKRKEMGVEQLPDSLKEAPEQKVIKAVSKPRINYWLVKAAQHEWIAAGYDGIAKMIEEGGRNRSKDIEEASFLATYYKDFAKAFRQRAGHPNYPQYTVEV